MMSSPSEQNHLVDSEFSLIEGVSVQLTPAPLSKRILAYAVDLAIIGAISYLLILVGVILFAILGVAFFAFFKHLSSVFWVIAIVLCVLATLTLFHGYFVHYEYKKGATPGKRIFGLQVVPTSKLRLSLGQCVLRDLFRWYVDALFIIPGLLSILLTKKHQRLGDLAASTLVVYSKQKENKNSFSYLSEENYYLYKETFQPKPIPLDYCKKYLNFSYPLFLSPKKVSYPPEYLKEWEEFIKPYLNLTQNTSFDQNSLLLFFAEYCSQTLKS